MSALSGQRASVTADELNSGKHAAVEAAIRVHEWVQNELQRLANAIGDLEWPLRGLGTTAALRRGDPHGVPIAALIQHTAHKMRGSHRAWRR